MEGLLTDKERVDAWELGIQVSQLQARGIRELHHIVQSVQEECRKQVHMLSEKIVQIQMDNNDKLQSMSGEIKIVRAELETERAKRKELEEVLERERAQSLATRDRVTDLTKAVEARVPLALHNREVSAREEALEELVQQVGGLELQVKQDKSAAEEAMAACLVEMNGKVTSSQLAERVAAVETALREHSEVKEADLRNLVSMVGERVSGLADRLGSTHAEGVEHLQKHDEALQLLERRHEETQAAIVAEAEEQQRRLAVFSAAQRQSLAERDARIDQASQAHEALSARVEVFRQRTDALETTMEGLDGRLKDAQQRSNRAEAAHQVLCSRVDDSDQMLKFMEKQQKLDIARPIASLETWRDEAGALLTELKARTGTLERVTLPALDAKLHDEVAARERLEHRARYLPKD